MNNHHLSVLLDKAVEALNIRQDGYYVDCTFGRGGHSKLILQKLGNKGRLLAFDKDEAAIRYGKQEIKDKRLKLVHSSFVKLPKILKTDKVDGVLLDLGVSSPQLDDVNRGFSFTADGPLDMRMNQAEGVSAATWLNSADEKTIANVLYKYGEEKKSRRIARAIVRKRATKPLATTFDLVECVKSVLPGFSKKHPATRTFQAIRIFLNRELVELSEILHSIAGFLKTGARLVVISFHSLEDRVVKQAFKCDKPNIPKEIPIQPETTCIWREIMKIKPKPDEVENNPRARSAIMRVAKRCVT